MSCSWADSSIGSGRALWHPRQIAGHLTLQGWRNSVEKLANLLIDFTLGSVFPSSYGSQAQHKLYAFARSRPPRMGNAGRPDGAAALRDSVESNGRTAARICQ